MIRVLVGSDFLLTASQTSDSVGAPFVLTLVGLGAVWISGINLAARRLAARRWESPVSKRALWFVKGVLIFPDWLMLPTFIVGLMLAAIGGLLLLAT